jgi:hypothetical protein
MSNFLSVRNDYDVYEPPIPRYDGDVGPKISKLSQLLPETPETITSPNSLVAGRDPNIPTQSASTEDANIMESANALLPMMKSMSVRGGTVAGSPLADPTIDISPPLADITGEISPPTDGVQPLNALTPAAKDYWKQPVIGNMPLDKFVQLAGMTAHALDPTGFGGILGKNMAQYATTERDVEQKNVLANLNMEHTTLANQKLKQDIGEHSANAIVRRRAADTLEADRQRKMTREIMADVDVDIDPTGAMHTAAIEKLKAGGADISLLPKIEVFRDSATGLLRKDDYNAWRNNYITTADQKAAASIADRKEKFGEITLYNNETREEIKWSYEKPKKAGEAFSLKNTGLGDNWTTVKPKEPPAPAQNRPGQTRHFVKNGVDMYEEWDVTDKKWKSLSSSVRPEKTEATGTWSYIGDAEDGTPMQMNSKTGLPRPMPLPSGMTITPRGGNKDATPLKVAEIESLLNGKDKDGNPYGVTPGAEPYINWYNQRDSKGYIYKVEEKPDTTWYGRGITTPTLTKVPLPLIDGQQVTGKDISDAVRQSKGKYNYDQILKMVFDKATKGVKK